MKPVIGSISASTTLKLPIRMPSGTARTEASRKPEKITTTLDQMWPSSEPRVSPFQPASRTSCGAARKSGRTWPP